MSWVQSSRNSLAYTDYLRVGGNLESLPSVCWRADFWYRADLRAVSRPLAVEAPDILLSWLRRLMAEMTKLIRIKQECSSRVYKAWTEPFGGANEFGDHQQESRRKRKD
jgi:hypothetical protein